MNVRLEGLLRVAPRGDRIAAINIAQRLWHAGDVRRTAAVGMYLGSSADR